LTTPGGFEVALSSTDFGDVKLTDACFGQAVTLGMRPRQILAVNADMRMLDSTCREQLPQRRSGFRQTGAF